MIPWYIAGVIAAGLLSKIVDRKVGANILLSWVYVFIIALAYFIDLLNEDL